MHICHIIEAAGGGSGQVVLDLVTANIAAGHDVTLIYAPQRADPRFLRSIQAVKSLRFVAFPMQRKVGAYDIRTVWKLYRLLKKIGPFDIIHSHSSKAGALARLAGMFSRTVQIYTPHAFMAMAPNESPIYGWIEWFLSRLCNAIICVSEEEKEFAQHRLKIPASKLWVIPNGISYNPTLSRAQARARFGFDNNAYIIGFIGRLVPQKNPLRLIKAFALAVAKNETLRLAIIGDGEVRQDAEKLIADFNLSSRVRFTGAIHARDYIAGFDCLVCSSDYEGFAVAFLEALAAGVPIVTTPVGGAKMSVINGQTGYITGFDPAQLATGITKLALKNPEEQAHIQSNCLHHAQLFTVDQMVRKTHLLYQTLLGKKAE